MLFTEARGEFSDAHWVRQRTGRYETAGDVFLKKIGLDY